MISAALFHEGRRMPLGLNLTLISESTGIVPGSKLVMEMLLSFGSLAVRFASSSLHGKCSVLSSLRRLKGKKVGAVVLSQHDSTQLAGPVTTEAQTEAGIFFRTAPLAFGESFCTRKHVGYLVSLYAPILITLLRGSSLLWAQKLCQLSFHHLALVFYQLTRGTSYRRTGGAHPTRPCFGVEAAIRAGWTES